MASEKDTEKSAQVDEMKRQMLSQILDNEARERCTSNYANDECRGSRL